MTQIRNANAQLGWIESLLASIDQEALQCAQFSMSGTDKMIKLGQFVVF